MINEAFEDKRLLEALDYIDERFIAEVTETYEVFDAVCEHKHNRRARHKAYRQFAAMAACLILLSGAFPVVVRFVSNTIDSIAGRESGTTDVIDETEIPENMDFSNDTEYIYGKYLEPIEGLEPLPVGIFEDLNEAYGYITFGIEYTNVSWGSGDSDRYLGCFNGYYIFFNTSAGGGADLSSPCLINIDGYTFYDSMGFSLCAYKDQEFFTLGEVYRSGIISEEQLKTIYLRNNEYMRYFDSNVTVIDLLPLTEEDFIELNFAWEKQYGNGKKLAQSIDDIKIKNYGESSGYWNGDLKIDCYGKSNLCIFFVTEQMNPMIEDTTKDIAGCEFRVGMNESEFWVLYNERIYTLQEAYESGIVSVDDVEGIALCYEMSKSIIVYE